jgi:predicted phage-related endonuclease
MQDDLRLSPDALAAISVPEGVTATPIVSREQWLALRRRDVTASLAAALFGEGVHPYQTRYGLWALKSGKVDEEQAENAAMRRGRLLEPVLMQLLCEDNPTWKLSPCRHFYSDPKARIGATPDFLATRPDIPGLGIIQGKTAGKFAFKKGWTGPDGDVEIPLWIAVQASVEAALTGASWAAVAVMTLGDGGLEPYLEDVPLRPALMAKLRKLAADFWDRVADERPYSPEFDRDAYMIAQIYAEADEGGEIDLSGNNRIGELLAKREGYKSTEKNGSDAEKARKSLDAEIINMLGNAARGRLADGRVIEAPTTRRKGYEVKPSSFRSVKIREAVSQ